MNYNLVVKRPALLITLIMYFGVTNYAVADDSFNSIGGYSLGQSCASNEFSSSDCKVSNPNDPLDTIKAKRSQIKKELTGGYNLSVECSIIDNKVQYIWLETHNSDDISVIKKTLKEKMGRPADEIKKNSNKPMNVLGNRIDGDEMELEYWFLSDNRRAATFTFITIPYGVSSISELKWSGGIFLSVNDYNKLEWSHLKQKGSLSSKQQKALTEEKKKEGVRRLLE
jgi:hypothetical protein